MHKQGTGTKRIINKHQKSEWYFQSPYDPQNKKNNVNPLSSL